MSWKAALLEAAGTLNMIGEMADALPLAAFALSTRRLPLPDAFLRDEVRWEFRTPVATAAHALIVELLGRYDSALVCSPLASEEELAREVPLPDWLSHYLRSRPEYAALPMPDILFFDVMSSKMRSWSILSIETNGTSELVLNLAITEHPFSTGALYLMHDALTAREDGLRGGHGGASDLPPSAHV